MPRPEVKWFKLSKSTPAGHRADNNYKKGPQTSITLNSVVDPRSVFIDMKICEKKIEAICDCGASVSCLSLSIYNELKQTHKFDLQPCLRKLKAANGLPIEVKGVVRLPVVTGPKSYEHDFCVLDESEAECLLGLDFFERNKCDPLFSCMKLELDSHSFVPLYHQQFDYGNDNVFRVISTETLSVPPGHTRIIPAHIPKWKRPQIQVCALFEPRHKFESNSEVSARNVLLILLKRSFR